MMAEVRAAAMAMGIHVLRKSKRDLILAIQSAEGNFMCYGTASEGHCDQAACAWRVCCLAESVQASEGNSGVAGRVLRKN